VRRSGFGIEAWILDVGGKHRKAAHECDAAHR
jgi:hypothetical protein